MKTNQRPSIPTTLRRKVLVEAGHRCAIPTCRNIEIDIHHIIPWETCKKHEYENLIALCPICHRRCHKGEIDKKSQRLYKTNLRFAHDKFSQIEVDTLFELNSLPDGDGLPWPNYLNLLLKRLFDAEYIKVKIVGHGMFVYGIKSSPDLILITEKGRSFLNSLGIKEL